MKISKNNCSNEQILMVYVILDTHFKDEQNRQNRLMIQYLKLQKGTNFKNLNSHGAGIFFLDNQKLWKSVIYLSTIDVENAFLWLYF